MSDISLQENIWRYGAEGKILIRFDLVLLLLEGE